LRRADAGTITQYRHTAIRIIILNAEKKLMYALYYRCKSEEWANRKMHVMLRDRMLVHIDVPYLSNSKFFLTAVPETHHRGYNLLRHRIYYATGYRSVLVLRQQFKMAAFPSKSENLHRG
jgi:hypothetical protein